MKSFRILFQRTLILQSQVLSRMPFYAVQLGKKPGVYNTWSECQEQTTGFRGARFKKFDTEAEALDFVNGKATAGKKSEKKEKETAVSSSSGARKTSKKAKKSDKDSEDSGSDSEKSGAADKRSASKRKLSKDKDSLADSSSNSKKAKQDDVDPDAVTVFTDGCCINNGKNNPCGGIGVYWGPDHAHNLSEKLDGRQTNNRAEIYAAVRAVQQAKSLGIKKLVIKTDSAFLINCQTNWVKKWKKNGWKTATGTDVTNREELELLDEEEKGFDVTYVHVPGHVGVEGNEEADKLAKAGAKK